MFGPGICGHHSMLSPLDLMVIWDDCPTSLTITDAQNCKYTVTSNLSSMIHNEHGEV